MSTRELGRLLDRMIKILNAHRSTGMQNTLNYLGTKLFVTPDAIQKWRQGRHKPDDETLAKMVEIGVVEADMNQTWAEQTLYLAQHPQRDVVLQRLFPSTETLIRNNLPRRSYVRFVGRNAELAEIMNRLAPESRDWLIPIEGIGGVGKSALALEIGWRFVNNSKQLPPGRRFDAVIWVSAKREVLTTGGVEPYQSTLTNLDDIYRAIGDVWLGVLSGSHEERSREIDKALRHVGRVLLIVDNLETVDDPRVISFLRQLPEPTKAIVTMRFQEDIHFPIRLRELDLEASQELVVEECQARDIVLDDEVMKRLLTYTLGMPLAIWWAIGLMSMKGHTVEATLDRLANPQGDLRRFIFNEAMLQLRKHWPQAHDVLWALTFFDLDSGATEEALAAVADLDASSIQQAIQCLLNLNLINRHPSGTRYTMLPLTRTFAQQDQTKEWEVVSRQRWSKYFLDFAERSLKRELPRERYWNSLAAIWALVLVNPEWPNLLDVLEWADQNRQEKLLIDLVTLLIHYMDRRALHAERLYYARKAAEASSRVEQKVDEALLRIDGLGWTLIEEGCLPEAEQEIQKGLRIVQRLGDESSADANDLTVLANTFQARVYLRQDELAKARACIKKAMSISCRPVPESRARMIAGDIESRTGNQRKAIRYYENAIQISQQFEEGTRSEFQYRLGFAYLATGDLGQAEAVFMQANETANMTIESVHAKHGLALVARAKNDINNAHKWAHDARAELFQLHPAHPLLSELDRFVESLD